MAVRLGQGLNIGGMMSGNAAAADLLVEAGRAKGAGLAAIGQGLGQGLATFGANRRADKVRAEENAFRQQSREDMLAERAADNARQDRQVGMRETEWKASVLGNLAQQYASEADMLDQAAAASGDPSLLAKAQAKRGDAARYRTALEALVSGKGSGVPDMPAPERTQPIGMYDSRVYTPPNAPATDGGGGGMDGAVTRIVDDAFAGGPGFFGPKGSYPAPEGTAPMAPVVEPKAQAGAATGAFGVAYTGDPAADAKLATYVQARVSDLRGSPAWNKMSAERRNLYERAEIEAVAKSGESQFGLKKQEMAFQNQMQAEDEARKKAESTATVAKLQDSLKAKGIDVMLPDDIETARKEYDDAVIKAPIRKEKKAQFDAKREDAATRFDRVMKARERGVKVQEDKANKPSDKDPNEQKVKLFKMHLAASEAASNRYDFADAEAEDIKANLILKELEDAYKGDAPSASAYPSWLPSEPAAKSEWDALSPEAKQKVINQRGR